MPLPAMMYIAIALIVFVILAVLLLYMGKIKGKKHPTRLTFIALFLVIAGILFGEDRLVGYSLIGCGILLSLLDIIIRYRTGNSQ
jgi:hypothetical protein